MDGNSIRVHDYQIRLFRTLAGLLALWCIFFLLVLINYHHFDLEFLWRITSLGPHKIDVPPVPALAWEFAFSYGSAKIIWGLFAETMVWIILLGISYVKPNVSCYLGFATGIVGTFTIIFYVTNTELLYPTYYARESLDHFDIMFYVAKSSAAFWLACSPKVFLLAALIVDSYKLYRHDETGVLGVATTAVGIQHFIFVFIYRCAACNDGITLSD